MLIALPVLAALVVATLVSAVRGSWVSVVATAVLAAAWLPVNNGRCEGPVLFRLAPGHGVTAFDLCSVAAVSVAVVAALRRRPPAGWRIAVLVVCACALPLGAAAAYFVWSGPAPARAGHVSPAR